MLKHLVLVTLYVAFGALQQPGRVTSQNHSVSRLVVVYSVDTNPRVLELISFGSSFEGVDQHSLNFFVD